MAMRLLVAGPELHSAERLLGCRRAIEAVFLGHGSGECYHTSWPGTAGTSSGRKKLKSEAIFGTKAVCALGAQAARWNGERRKRGFGFEALAAQRPRDALRGARRRAATR